MSIFTPAIQISTKLFLDYVAKITFGYLNGQVQGKLLGGRGERREKRKERLREGKRKQRSHSWEKPATKELKPPEIPVHRQPGSLQTNILTQNEKIREGGWGTSTPKKDKKRRKRRGGGKPTCEVLFVVLARNGEKKKHEEAAKCGGEKGGGEETAPGAN